ncbi:MAG: type VII toxin-antitoxin system HepT family RNase toxin [Metallibacterium scheffleri]
MDRALIEQKVESLRQCTQRIHDKCPPLAEDLARDIDAQDIIALNLTRAVQLCVDIASHWIAASGLPAPQTMGEAFARLADAGVLDAGLAQRLRGAVGFRNVACTATVPSTGRSCTRSCIGIWMILDRSRWRPCVMPNDNPQMARRPALSSQHPRAGTSSPSVCVGDGRRFTNSEAGHPDTMPVSRTSAHCCHPERSEGSRFHAAAH